MCDQNGMRVSYQIYLVQKRKAMGIKPGMISNKAIKITIYRVHLRIAEN